MKITFFKYQGTGNDFVIVDNRQQVLSKNNTNLIKFFCDRKFGVGADGLIFLESPESEREDFKMVYFNADGKEGSMCGNGGRCTVSFAAFLGIIEERCFFTAIDGSHEAMIKDGEVSLKMKDVEEVEIGNGFLFLDSGSPHHVIFTGDTEGIDVKQQGESVRYSEKYSEIGGTNVNFVQQTEESSFKVRTYERGVEDETLSCGTGVTAVALAARACGKTKGNTVRLETPGGTLSVSFEKEGNGFRNIWLSGPAQQVFKGELEC